MSGRVNGKRWQWCHDCTQDESEDAVEYRAFPLRQTWDDDAARRIRRRLNSSIVTESRRTAWVTMAETAVVVAADARRFGDPHVESSSFGLPMGGIGEELRDWHRDCRVTQTCPCNATPCHVVDEGG